MNRTSKLLLGLLVLVALSCNTLTRSLPASSPPTSNPRSPIEPTSPRANPTSSSQLQPTATSLAISATQCDGDKWTFSPSTVYRYPEGNGFDLTIVDLAVHNGSDKYWANNVGINYSYIYITTEDGYNYKPFNGDRKIPDVPKSPYSGTTYSQSSSGFFQIPVIPPSFTVLGTFGVGGFGGGLPGKVYRYTVGFEVASSQKNLTLHINRINILCVNPNYQYAGDKLPELTYSLDDLANYRMPATMDYPSLGSQSIVIPDRGTIEYKGYSEEEGFYLLNFSFTNPNGGYSVNGSFKSFLIGDDGFIRSPSDDSSVGGNCFYNTYNAGPAQTVDLCPIPFKVPTGVTNLNFVFYDYLNKGYAAFSFAP